MTGKQQYDILRRLGLKKADVTNPHIVILCSEISSLDKQLEKLRLPVDNSNKENDLKAKDEIKTNSL